MPPWYPAHPLRGFEDVFEPNFSGENPKIQVGPRPRLQVGDILEIFWSLGITAVFLLLFSDVGI